MEKNSIFSNKSANLKRLITHLKNPILIFLAIRYLGYALLFVRGIVIAKVLGPYSFGLWGRISLMLQYFSFTTFGINYALTVKLSTTDQQNHNYSSTAFAATLIIDLILISGGVMMLVLAPGLFFSTEAARYFSYVLVIAAMNNLLQILINIYRVRNKILRISIIELLNAVILTVSILIFNISMVIQYQLLFMLISYGLSIALLLYHKPFQIAFNFNIHLLQSLLKLGLPLLIYNLSFYLIPISARTIVSVFYPAEILGYFTLANSFSSAVLLGLQSFGWSIYPNVLSNSSAKNSIEATASYINWINKIYTTSCFFFTFAVLSLLPIIFLYIPMYSPALPIITIFLISQSVLSISFGNNALAISRNQQKKVARVGLITVFSIVLLGGGISLLKMNYIWIAITVLCGSILYTYSQAKLGLKILGQPYTALYVMNITFPIGAVIAMVIVITGSFSSHPLIWNAGGFAIFILTNLMKIKEVWNFVRKQVFYDNYVVN